MFISYSREALYLRCPHAHYLSYVEKLMPKKPARPLYFGNDFHKLLELRSDKEARKEAIKEIKGAYEELPKEYQTILGETYVDDLKQIFTDYQKIYKEEPLPDKTEQAFEIKVGRYKGDPVYFVGKIDGLYLRDRLIVEEHKTFSRKPDPSFLVMNTQKCLYAKAVEEMAGVLPDGIMWDYIKSTPAKEPAYLEKSQKLSMAKSEQITPYSWERACKRYGITSEAVISQGKNHYAGNVQNFFFRYTLDVIPEMVEKVWNDFVYIAKEICQNGGKNQTMNITRDCSWCSFQPICYAMLTGADAEHIKKKDFCHKTAANMKGAIRL